MSKVTLRTLVVGYDLGTVLIATNSGYLIRKVITDLNEEDQIIIKNMTKEELLSYQIEVLENLSADLYPGLQYDDYGFIFDFIESDQYLVPEIFNIIKLDFDRLYLLTGYMYDIVRDHLIKILDLFIKHKCKYLVRMTTSAEKDDNYFNMKLDYIDENNIYRIVGFKHIKKELFTLYSYSRDLRQYHHKSARSFINGEIIAGRKRLKKDFNMDDLDIWFDDFSKVRCKDGETLEKYVSDLRKLYEHNKQIRKNPMSSLSGLCSKVHKPIVSRYNGNDKKNTFDYIRVEIDITRRGRSDQELYDMIRKYKKEIDNLVIISINDSKCLEKYNLNTNFLELRKMILRKDMVLEYTFGLKLTKDSEDDFC